MGAVATVSSFKRLREALSVSHSTNKCGYIHLYTQTHIQIHTCVSTCVYIYIGKPLECLRLTHFCAQTAGSRGGTLGVAGRCQKLMFLAYFSKSRQSGPKNRRSRKDLRQSSPAEQEKTARPRAAAARAEKAARHGRWFARLERLPNL